MREPFRKLMNNGILKIMIAGHGGQGVLDLGNFIAYQALKDGYHIVYTPTYGPESRGGKVRCWVTISGENIDCPIAELLDVLIILNKPSMDYVEQLRSGGTLFYNISIIDIKVKRNDISVIPVPCSDLTSKLDDELEKSYAQKVDSSKALNCAMYGSYLYLAGFAKQDAISEAEDTFKYLYQGGKERFIPLNLAGVKKGYEYQTTYQVDF